jgi:hypothetical protein
MMFAPKGNRSEPSIAVGKESSMESPDWFWRARDQVATPQSARDFFHGAAGERGEGHCG